MANEKEYLIKWEIDMTASSPEEAARLALEIQRDKLSEAIAFRVKEQATGEETDVDLMDSVFSYFDKSNKIEYIKETISKYGIFTTAEIQADTSPAINVLGDMSILIEEFQISQCIAFTYVHSTCVAETNMFYEDLEPEVIDQIFDLVKEWEEMYFTE